MTIQLTKPGAIDVRGLFIARTEELEGLNARLKDSVEAASRDSAALRQTIAMKDEILGLVAHELRGPLTTILGNASILLRRRDELLPSIVESALQDIQTDGKRLQRLISNLLILARPEEENPMPDEPLDLCHLVRATIVEHCKGFPQRQIQLVTQETVILVTAHHDYTEEVFINLLSNAEKYSPPEEPIAIRLESVGGQVEAAVLDRGPGIAADEVQLIFQPFYRSPLTSSKAMGLGLGLAVCKRLIEIQGGRIWTKPREGGGSEFVFVLPLSMEPALSSGASGLLATPGIPIEEVLPLSKPLELDKHQSLR